MLLHVKGWMGVTIQEDKEDSGVGEFLSTQQIDVLHAQVKGQLNNGSILHVGGDVCHQSQIFHQTTSLNHKRPINAFKI